MIGTMVHAGRPMQRIQVVERVISVLSAKSLLLGKEDLFKFAPDMGPLWTVEDVMLQHVTCSRYDLDQLNAAVREEEVLLFSHDELAWRAPLGMLHLVGNHHAAHVPIRIEGPSSATVQLWLSLAFKYDPSKEAHA